MSALTALVLCYCRALRYGNEAVGIWSQQESSRGRDLAGDRDPLKNELLGHLGIEAHGAGILALRHGIKWRTEILNVMISLRAASFVLSDMGAELKFQSAAPLQHGLVNVLREIVYG